MLWKGFLLCRFGPVDSSDVLLLSVYQDCLFQNCDASTDDSLRLVPSTIPCADPDDIDMKMPSKKRRRITFADVKGLPLEYVRELSAKEPTYTPGKIVPTLSLYCNNGFVSPPRVAYYCSRRSAAMTCQFTQPGTSPDFFERVAFRHVVLEHVTPKPTYTHGTVRVLNMAYHKEVVVRWSRNKWQSYKESRCSYVEASSDGTMDKFSFTIPRMTEAHESIEFALCYKVEGREFWDNNDGHNYILTNS